MDSKHQMQYQELFRRLGQHAANYPTVYRAIIECAQKDRKFAHYIGYQVANV